MNDFVEDLRPLGRMRIVGTLILERSETESRHAVMIDSEVHDAAGIAYRGQIYHSLSHGEYRVLREASEGGSPPTSFRGGAPPKLLGLAFFRLCST